jgi:hypothetical protein
LPHLSPAPDTANPPPRRARRGTAKAEPETTLPRSVLIELALERLNQPEIKDYPGMKFLRAELERELASPAGPDEETKLRYIERLHRTLSLAAPVFKPLNELAKPENYLFGVQKVIVHRVNMIKGMYAAAILSAYSDIDPDEQQLAGAEKTMQQLPAFIVEKYLGPYGIKQVIDQLAELSQQIQALRAAGDVKAAHGALHYTLADPQRLAAKEADLRRDLEAARAAKGDADKSTETIRLLTANAQAMVGVTTAVALYEQFTFWTNDLRDSFADIYIELGKDVVGSVADVASTLATGQMPKEEKETWEVALDYSLKLESIVYDLIRYDTVTDPDRLRELNEDAIRRLGAIVNTSEFDRDVKRIQDRLETVQTVNILATVVLIAAAAALTAGVAGAAVGGALEFAGASAFVAGTGEVVAGALAFTIVSREGQKLAFGKAEGSFGWDFVTNALMFGFLKGVDMAYTAAFKLGPQAGAAAKLAVGLGRAGTAMIALQSFAEAEHMITKKRPMTGDERAQTALQNLVVLVALSAGRFITGPIENRITGALLGRMKPIFKSRLENLTTERGMLQSELDALKRHEGAHDPEAVEGVLKRIQSVWEKELRLLENAAKRKVVNEEELAPILEKYRAELARIELQLARLNVSAQLGVNAPTFRPVAAGIVLYTPGAEKALKEFHEANQGELKPSKFEGVLEGRIGGELTFYVPEGQAFAELPEAGHLAVVRDAALSEAAADPKAQQGLENLGKTFGTLKADEVLVAAAPKDLGALLRSLADAEVVSFKRPGFYRELAKNRAAMDFSDAYGAKTLRNLALKYGWGDALKNVLARATAKIESAETPDARAELIRGLQTETTVERLDALIGRERAPRPPRPVQPTKRNLGVDRRLASWGRFRESEVDYATRHNETPTETQLDQRADGLLILDRAKSGAFDHLKHNSKVEIIDRFDELCIQAGIDRGRTNALRGSLSEVLIRPNRFEPKRAFKDRAPVPWNTAGASKLDYHLEHPGFTEWVEQKSDILSGGHKRRDGAWEVGVSAARGYRKDAIDDLNNLPEGDRLSIEFIREPNAATKKVMLQVLFGADSPIFRVRFGGGPWLTRP